MNNFSYTRATTSQDALHLISTRRNAKFLGGGTNLLDLMRENIEQPEPWSTSHGFPRPASRTRKTAGSGSAPR